MRRWRRCLITTTPIEIAARAAIAIRIGTRGEEELPFEVEALAGCCSATVPAGCAPVVPLPGLPWPVPPSLPVVGLLLAPDDAPPDEDPDPEAPELPDADGDDPPVEELSAGGLLLELWAGGFVCPLTVGTSVSYSGTPDSA
ncbi:MAG: hypothetical protein U0R26_05530 [Solirubrobacterales bacterium]